MNRRYFLGTLALASGCSVRRTAIQPPAAPYAGRRLARVNVASERVIRTVAGLRPYRASGFVVRTESMDGKTIVHNYGHGGGGITLSWGTAHLAVEQALPTNARRMAVIGAGAVGLATGRLLQEHGVEVTIYAKDLPPATTSNIAGGQVFPVTVYGHDSVTPAFLAQFVEASRFSYRRYQLMVGEYYGIRWMPNYLLDTSRFLNAAYIANRAPLWI
jgi:D-amino-acid oxidase